MMIPSSGSARCGVHPITFLNPVQWLGGLQTLSAIQLWRVFLISHNFREIVHSFTRGLEAVGSFFLVLFIVFYMYSYSGYLLFKDTEMPEHQTFGSLFDSMLVMFQLFVGEGWHSVMIEAVDRTNKALVWFFVSYIVITGVLFTNLFMGESQCYYGSMLNPSMSAVSPLRNH